MTISWKDDNDMKIGQNRPETNYIQILIVGAWSPKHFENIKISNMPLIASILLAIQKILRSGE